MRSLARATAGERISGGLRVPVPRSRRAWLLVLVGAMVAALLAAGLAQIFRVGVFSSSGQSTVGPNLEWREMLGVLTRQGSLSMAGEESIDVDVLLATPQYFGAARRQLPASAKDHPSLVFFVTEIVHIDDLPAAAPRPFLSVGSSVLEPAEMVVLADSPHHRATLVRFSVDGTPGLSAFKDGANIEVDFPNSGAGGGVAESVKWTLPLQYSDEYASSDVVIGAPGRHSVVPGGVSGMAVLALMGGLLAAMWPCLFQLTAYFIPAMAGMSMHEVNSAKGLKPHMGVVRMAVFFVLGFTVVYTAAGAIIGYGSQQLSNLDSFLVWQRYIGIGAGVVLLGLALRLAARARAPLVCKMPVLSRTAKSGVTSPWESMLVGVTFATGCMTCFGSAVLIGMVLYAGLAGSPLVGATLLFLFSLGMGIPLVIGAVAMARVLPLLFRIEKVIPWMGLASAALIAAYAGLLISGNFMSISAWFYRLTGFGSNLG